MGTSKIATLSGVYIILGLYALSFNAADETTSARANNASVSVQTEHLANTGVYLAMLSMGSNSAISYFLPRSLSTMGGRVTYFASHPASLSSSERLITSRGVINSSRVETSAIVRFDKGRWRLVRICSVNRSV